MRRHHDVLIYEGNRAWRFVQILPEGCPYNGSAAARVTPAHEEGDPMCFAPLSPSDAETPSPEDS